MKNIVKSFYNYMLTFWYQFLAFVLFVIIASALTIGFVSNSLQIMVITSQINQTEKQWDYDINTYFGQFDNDFIYDYFETPEDNPVFNSFNETLLNFNAVVDNGQTLKEYLESHNNGKWSTYVGQFIRSNVFSTINWDSHQVVLPNSNGAKKADFFSIVNPTWVKLTGDMFGEVYHLIDDDLARKYHEVYPNDSLEISYNRTIKYVPKDSNQVYNFEPLNLGLINNVVSSNLSQKRLAKMKDNEVLVNDKFAKAHGFKIGDTIKLHDFMVLNEDQEKYQNVFKDRWFNQKYKIIGWGMKIQNLFADFELFDPDFVDNSSNVAFFYLTNHEFDRYGDYWWFYNNQVHHQTDNSQESLTQTSYLERLKVQTNDTAKNFSKYVGETLKTPSMNQTGSMARTSLNILFSYDTLYFAQAFQLYLVEAIIFTFVGLISLIFAMLFINYSIKKQLRQMRRQLGLFKSLGYGTTELSTALWSRTYILLMVGVILGYLISIPIQILVNHILMPNFYLEVQEIWINPYFLLAFFLVIPMVLSLLNFAAILRYLRKNALSMIYRDKNFSLGSNYGKTLSWMLKSHSIKLGNWQINFSWKQFFMSLFIPLFFMFGSLLLMVQFNVKTLMNTTVDLNSHIYQNNINYSIKINERSSPNSNDDKSVLKDKNFKNFRYISYNNATDLAQYHNQELDEDIKTYLESNDLMTRLSKIESIIEKDLNHKAVKLADLLAVGQQLVDDFETSSNLTSYPGLNANLNDLVKQLKDFLTKAKPYQDRLANPEVQLTINNAFIKQNQDYPILKLGLTNYGVSKVLTPWSFFLVNDENRQIFVDLNYQTLVNNSLQENKNLMPVIISEEFSITNHTKVGDVIYATLTGGLNKSIPFKVVGINQDKVSSNFYGLESYFFQYFMNSPTQTEPTEPTFNMIYSKGNLFDSNILNWNTTKFNNDYFNFYYSTAQEEISVLTLLQNPNKLIDYFNWNSLATANFKSLATERYLANKTTSDIETLINILLGFTFALLLTLFVVFFILGTVDNQMQIKLLKAFGYGQNYISTKLLSRHIVSITLGIVFAILVNFFVWDLMIRLIYAQFGIMLYNPFSINWTIISTLLIVFLFFAGSMITFTIVKKTSPVIKAL